MAVNGISSMLNSRMRLSGLSSGLDTDTIISQLMSVEKLPINKLYQKKQLAEWRRDDYRSVTNLLRGFKTEFFDVLKPATNMLSQSTYQKYTVNSTDPQAVTASGGAEVTSLSHRIIVNEIAKASNATSTAMVSKPLLGSDLTSEQNNITDYNNSFTLTYNGVSKVIKLENGTYAGAAAIIGNGTDDGLLRQKVREAFSGVDAVVDASGGIKFTPANAANVSDVITVYPGNASSDNLLSVLGLNSDGTGSVIASESFPLTVAKDRRFSMSITEGEVTTTKDIEWTADKVYSDSTTLATDLQAMVDTAFGAGKVTVDGSGGKITFTKHEGVDSLSLSNSQLNLKTVERLGFAAGDSNKLSLSDTMEEVSASLAGGPITFDANGEFKLTINNQSNPIVIKKSDTLSTFLYKVNNSDAGVTISYSSYNDVFTMQNRQTGAGTISLNDNGSGFFAASKLTAVNPGQDAEFVLDDLAGTRTTNTFTVDGVSYTLLKKDQGVEKTITLAQESDTVFNTIKSFVEKYNEVISTINTKFTEKYDRDYQPLTEEQKDGMKEDDVKKWEENARKGLLRNDSMLQGIVFSMRRALSDDITNVSASLSSIGITTGTYEDRGKLIINETKLKEAISNNPDEVMNLFSKKSSISYSPDLDSGKRALRYKDEGLAQRLSDILADNIRTTRDMNGRKGSLLEKAGIEGDFSEFKNLIYDEIDRYDDKIKDLAEKLIDKENAYYMKFSAMETALNKMNAQSSWLASQFGQGQ